MRSTRLLSWSFECPLARLSRSSISCRRAPMASWMRFFSSPLNMGWKGAGSSAVGAGGVAAGVSSSVSAGFGGLARRTGRGEVAVSDFSGAGGGPAGGAGIASGFTGCALGSCTTVCGIESCGSGAGCWTAAGLGGGGAAACGWPPRLQPARATRKKQIKAPVAQDGILRADWQSAQTGLPPPERALVVRTAGIQTATPERAIVASCVSCCGVRFERFYKRAAASSGSPGEQLSLAGGTSCPTTVFKHAAY